jgi:hypothetical protein
MTAEFGMPNAECGIEKLKADVHRCPFTVHREKKLKAKREKAEGSK